MFFGFCTLAGTEEVEVERVLESELLYTYSATQMTDLPSNNIPNDGFEYQIFIFIFFSSFDRLGIRECVSI